MGRTGTGSSLKEQKKPLSPTHKCGFFAIVSVIHDFLTCYGILPRYCAMLLFLTAGLGQLLQTYLLKTKYILVHRPYVTFISLEELVAFPGKYLTFSCFFIVVSLSKSVVKNNGVSTVLRLNLLTKIPYAVFRWINCACGPLFNTKPILLVIESKNSSFQNNCSTLKCVTLLPMKTSCSNLLMMKMYFI